MTAVKLARLHVIRMENDTSAAAFYRGMHLIEQDEGEQADDRHVMVIDVGGGSFKAAISSPGLGLLDAQCACGDCNLGGIDIDKEIVEYCAQQF